MTRHVVGILGFNSQERLDRCLASVLASPVDDMAVWVLDNGTTPLEVTRKEAEYVPAREHTGGGFTAALRLFLSRAMIPQAGGEVPITATFLNDDLELEPGCLARMVAIAQEPRVSIVCPMQVAMQSPQVIVCGGTGRAYPAGEHKGGQRGVHWRARAGARWMPFAAVTFSLAAVRDVGLPDDNMALWFSDSDYCIRARYAGYAVIYTGEQAVVRHEVSASCGKMDPEERRRKFLADQTAFARKWSGVVLAEYSS